MEEHDWNEAPQIEVLKSESGSYFNVADLKRTDANHYRFYRLFDIIKSTGRFEVNLITDEYTARILDSMFAEYLRCESPPWIGAVSGDGKISYFPKWPRGCKVTVIDMAALNPEENAGKIFFEP